MLRTVDEALHALFPHGTGKNSTFDRAPDFPATIFGAVAYLLEEGGVYHRLLRQEFLSEGNARNLFSSNAGNLVISNELVSQCTRAGRRWFETVAEFYRLELLHQTAQNANERKKIEKALSKTKKIDGEIRSEIQGLWDHLTSFGSQPIVSKNLAQDKLDWWEPALKLLIISDEAARDYGYHSDNPWEYQRRRWNQDWETVREIPKEDRHFLRTRSLDQLEALLNSRVVRVVPKSRTPAVGCTMRTMSHNLAIVPPEGIVDVNWFREPVDLVRDREPLNILLIPFPYKVSSKSFQGACLGQPLELDPTPGSRPARNPRSWGMFEITQSWLEPHGVEQPQAHFASFVDRLVEEASKDCGQVHGVVLPEFALDWEAYAAIVRHFTADGATRKIDFLVGGVSAMPELPNTHPRKRGNFVATTTFWTTPDGKRFAFSHLRSKHHRWQLTATQITDYALGASLDPNILWWEGIDIPQREIDLTVFRKGAIFTAMICEDLARSEPCHEPLRSVGPNLVFVLLMDGAQLPGRWATRYSTALADDPGCSVLTLTSLGLMERTNNSHRFTPACRNVSIWKDDTGNTIQMACPEGAQALLLTLAGEEAEECTIDGRPNWDAQAWRYRGHQAVRLSQSEMTQTWKWISG